jgi:transcription antitermination factor NusG
MKKKTVVTGKFHKGDPVMLVAGTYYGTTGIFIKLRPDKNWADIKENNGTVNSHPIAWMAHAETQNLTE